MRKILLALFFLTPIFIVAAEKNTEIATSPTEDLMREHGVLNRLLLIYQEIATRLENTRDFPMNALADSAQIVRNFVENYHEKLEEQYIFPIVEKGGKLKDLVKTLRDQHQAGRHLTDYILAHAKEEELKDDVQRYLLADYLKLFIRMYRPHEAREDTILFPEFKKLITQKEYDRLGDLFEGKEQELFGEKGFEKIVAAVTQIEKSLNIYNLSDFTPKFSSH